MAVKMKNRSSDVAPFNHNKVLKAVHFGIKCRIISDVHFSADGNACWDFKNFSLRNIKV
jgi:hypothetical protein